MFKLTKKLRKQIKTLSAKLPPDYYHAGTRVHGSEILKEEKYSAMRKKFEADGHTVDIDKTYRILNSIPVPMNHFSRMCKVFEDKGPQGIDEYVRKYLTHKTQNQDV